MEKDNDALPTVNQRSDLGKFHGSEIKRLGEFIYGPKFAAQLARKLGVHPSTVRRWVTGQHAPTAARSIEFAAIVRNKRGERVQYEVLLFHDLAHVASPSLEAILLIPLPLPLPLPLPDTAAAPPSRRRRTPKTSPP